MSNNPRGRDFSKEAPAAKRARTSAWRTGFDIQSAQRKAEKASRKARIDARRNGLEPVSKLSRFDSLPFGTCPADREDV